MPEVRELPPGETALAARALLELRPHRAPAEDLVARIDAVQRPQGYRLLGSFDRGDADAAAAAGFRVVEMLAWGRALYVDDLVTLPDRRGRGHADALFAWLGTRPRGWGATSSTSTPASRPTGPTRTASTSATACGSARTTSPGPCSSQHWTNVRPQKGVSAGYPRGPVPLTVWSAVRHARRTLLRALLLTAAATLALASPAAAADLQNGGFEDGLDHWTATKANNPNSYYGPTYGPGTTRPADCRVPDGVCVIGSDSFTTDATSYEPSQSHTVEPAEGSKMLRLGGPFTSPGQPQTPESYRVEQTFVVDAAQTELDLAYKMGCALRRAGWVR